MLCCGTKYKAKIHPSDRSPIFVNQDQPKSILKKRRSSIHPNHQEPISMRKKSFVTKNPIGTKRKCINENKKKMEENMKQREEFTKKFLSEIITCGGCKQRFSLGDAQLTMNCASCNEFFHCNIAGRCIGDNCKIECDGEICRLGYCKGCVNPNIPMNTDNTNICICKSCEKNTN